MPLQIHQLWIGPHAKPEPWLDNIRAFAADSGFAYKLWDEQTLLEGLNWSLVPGLREAYERLEEEALDTKADILRGLLLHQYGGVFIESDIVVINPEKVSEMIRAEAERGGLWGMWGPSDGPRQISTGLLGAAKSQHPFWKGYAEYIVHSLKNDTKAKTGSEALTKLYEALKEKLPEMELYEADNLLAVSPNKVKKEDGVAAHEEYIGSGGGPLFQYGYKANGFQDVFDEASGLSQKGGGGGIPKVIHQIWLGKNPEPTEWTDTVEKFAKDHGWRYKLWRDADMKKFDFGAIEGLPEVYRSFGSELAGRADIVRYMILYQEGGLYIDADSVVMKPAKFAKFLESNRAPVFFAWENLSKARTRKLNIGGRRRLISNGTVGTVPRHPFFKAMLEESVKNLKALKGKPLEAWRAVGPYMIVQLYERLKGGVAKDVHMYPMRYFYPRHWKGITDPELHKKVKIPGQSMLFQYGYSTNGFAKIFKEREAELQAARRTRRQRK